jgi:hypothetical protein
MTAAVRFAALAVVLVGGARSAVAQQPPEQGETVRLVVADPALRSPLSVVGVFDGLGRDSLYLAREAYSRSLVRSIEVARGEGTYFTLGLALGSSLGGLTGALLGASDDHANLQREGQQGLARGAAIGAAAGALLGTVVGSLVRRTRWVRVPLAVEAQAARSGRLHVRLAWGL